jgi:hypothetical protein
MTADTPTRKRHARNQSPSDSPGKANAAVAVTRPEPKKISAIVRERRGFRIWRENGGPATRPQAFLAEAFRIQPEKQLGIY